MYVYIYILVITLRVAVAKYITKIYSVAIAYSYTLHAEQNMSQFQVFNNI